MSTKAEVKEQLRKMIERRDKQIVREKQWSRFLFCYVRGDRDRSDAYLAELRAVFDEHYPESA